MLILSFLVSLILNVYPPEILAPIPNTFICDGDILEVKIYNNQNGDFTPVHAREELDAGAFSVLEWRDMKLMLPRTFNEGESSFTDRKWFWAYEDQNSAVLKRRSSLGKLETFSCISKPGD